MNSSSGEDFKTLTEYVSGKRAAKDASVSRLLNQHFGSWFLKNHLGDGGQGLLFYATKPYDDNTGFEEGAFKVTFAEHAREQDWKAYEAEVQSLRRLKSAYISRLLDDGVTDRMPWLVSGFIQGQSLAQMLSKGHALPKDLWFLLAEHLFTALRKAHMHDIMHRDVKPQNIMFDEIENLFILIDFGLAAREDCLRLGTRAGSKTLSQAEKKMGTLLYQAPEQIESDPSTASDVFAAGVVLYEAVAGSNPWIRSAVKANKNVADQSTLAEEILNSEPNYMGFTDDQKMFFEYLLDKEPLMRPTAAEALEAIASWKKTGSLVDYFEGETLSKPSYKIEPAPEGLLLLQTFRDVSKLDNIKKITIAPETDHFDDAQVAVHEFFDELPKKDFSVVVGVKDNGTFSLNAQYQQNLWMIDIKVVSGVIPGHELEKAFIEGGPIQPGSSKWDLVLSGENATAQLGELLLKALRRLFPDNFPKIRLY